LAAIAASVFAAPAHAAKIDAKDVENSSLVVSDVSVPTVTGATPGNAGGYVTCPVGLQTLSGGAFMFPTGQTPTPSTLLFTRVNSSTPTTDNLGWYADASNGTNTPMSLRVILRCVEPALVQGQKLALETRSAGNGEFDGATAKCPGGRVAISGGTFVHRTGMGPAPAVAGVSWVGSSGPVKGGTGWYGDARSFEDTLDISVVAHCLPLDRLKDYELAEKDFAAKSNGLDFVKISKCPKSTAALAAGAYFHKPGKEPKPENAETSILKASGILDQPREFAVGGRSIFDDNLNMSLRAFCVS
jgi:hypothetical protein